MFIKNTLSKYRFKVNHLKTYNKLKAVHVKNSFR